MKRIVFHVPSLIGGGAERVWVLMANELAARGHDVTLFTWNAGGPNAGLRSDAVHLVDLGLPLRNEGFGKRGTFRGLWRSVRFFARHQPDAVFSAPDFANLITTLALTLSRSRALFFPSFHAAASLPSERVGARLAVLASGLMGRRATRAIAVSKGVGADVVVRGLAAKKLVVINNPLPPSRPPAAMPAAWQVQLSDPAGGPVIVTAGRLTAVKDHRTLIAAFAQLRRSRPARLAICGEGPLRAELEAYTRELGVADDVLLPGYTADLAACYAVADLFALSSRSEGFGNVLIEAMEAGVPIVSTDCPHGPRDILRDGAFGTLVRVGDAAAMAVAMGQMLDDPTPPETLKARAADFAVERVGDQYEALLRG